MAQTTENLASSPPSTIPITLLPSFVGQCLSTSEQQQKQQQQQLAVILTRPPPIVRTVLVPPMNFAMIASGVYRSGYPGKKNEPFLRNLGLKSIICITPEPYRNNEFIHTHNVKLFQYPIIGNKEPFTTIPDQMVGDAIGVILDKRNHPLLIHCNKGKHRVGCVVGCLRRVQNWSTTFIFDEYQRFAGTKVRILDQEFIELFNISTVRYDSGYRPEWLW